MTIKNNLMILPLLLTLTGCVSTFENVADSIAEPVLSGAVSGVGHMTIDVTKQTCEMTGFDLGGYIADQYELPRTESYKVTASKCLKKFETEIDEEDFVRGYNKMIKIKCDRTFKGIRHPSGVQGIQNEELCEQ